MRRNLRAIKTFRIIAIVSFLTLVMAALTGVVMGILSTDIAHVNGIPQKWADIPANNSPDYIYLPATYWDQRSDVRVGSSDVGRQFEWTRYQVYGPGVIAGLVKDQLGADGFPVATNVNPSSSIDITSRYVTGNDPTQPGDNFYRWWHEVDGKSKLITDQTLRFKKISEGVYQYGGAGVFPLDNIPAAKTFSSGDYSGNTSHNFYFTMKTEAPFTVKADGTEEFQFEGDDDVWVFLNDKLVLDIGGLHSAIKASFKINGTNSITATVNGKSKTITDIPIKKGDRAVISLFYAERSTTEANCLITIRSMEFTPATIESVAAVSGDKINYLTSIHNTNPHDQMDILGLSSYIDDEKQGFIDFVDQYLEFSFTPSIESSWQKVNVAPPSNAQAGFMFDDIISLSQYGTTGDTVYFRYSYSPEGKEGSILNVPTALTEVGGVTSAISTSTNVPYSFTTEPDPGDDDCLETDSCDGTDPTDPGDGDDEDDCADENSDVCDNDSDDPGDDDDCADTESCDDTDPNDNPADCIYDESDDENTDCIEPAVITEDPPVTPSIPTPTPPVLPVPPSITINSPDGIVTEFEPVAATNVTDDSNVTSSKSLLQNYRNTAGSGASAIEIILLFDLVIFATSYCMWRVLKSNLSRYTQGWRVKVNPNAILK